MLGASSLFTRTWKTLCSWGVPVLLLGLALASFTWNHSEVFFQGNVYFTDGDCYARMTRVRMLQENGFAPIHRHDFENYPIGTIPHTTAPLDYLIAGLAAVIGSIFSDPLPLAGAWISPILGLVLMGILAVWWKGEAFGWATLLLLGGSPIVAHGFLLGRPDHQSLLILLMGVALVAETGMWVGKAHGKISAIAWAMALWVSLFEPAILLMVVLVLRLLARRLSFDLVSAGIFCAVLLIGFLVDGFRMAAFDSHFGNWTKNIGELRRGSLVLLGSWGGMLALAAPFVLFVGWRLKKEPVYFLLGSLIVILGGLSILHLRWGYFYVLAVALGLPWLLRLFRWRILACVVFLLSFWPVAGFWEGVLYPDDHAVRVRAESVGDAVALRDAALQIKDLPFGGVLAPWWFSPAIHWWSGQPCVAGTSHQSLPGIVDASEFYLSEGDGREIVDRRQVGYIFAYEPERIVSNAAQILGCPVPANPLAARLYDRPSLAPYRLLYANRFFKVFEAGSDPARAARESSFGRGTVFLSGVGAWDSSSRYFPFLPSVVDPREW